MPGTNLIVPVVLWGKHAPTHCISSVYLSRDQKTLVTGCYDGQICIWQVEPETLKMTPRCLLVGHTAPVTCLSRASIIQDNNFIVSSSEAGEMCTWDLVDGKCRESVKLTQVHTNIQAYHMCNSEDLRLFCNGYYAEILIMDPFSLEILFSLSSKMNPDWISALHVLRPSSRKDDVVLAISITGTVKVWSLLGHENKQSEPIYENESKQIRCLNALSLNCCAYNQRTVLIVCAKYCQIYDAGDFSVLCSIQAPSGERWMSGDFLAPDRVLVWSTEGKGYLYKLPANKLRGKAISSSVPDHKGFHGPSVDHDSPVLFSILAHPDNKLLSCPPAMRFVLTSVGGKQRRLLLRGDSAGVVSLWNIDDAAQPQPGNLSSHAPIVLTSLEMAWAEMNPSPVGILDQFSHPEEPEIKLTASIYLLAANRLVVGRDDGSIVIVNATHTVQLQLLHGNHQQLDDWPPHQLLLGHIGRVNCLLYPHHVHHRYDKSHLVSGGIDFAVCLWDLFSGALLHRFCVHAGEITQLIVPPQNCSPRIQKCICSVASDHSVTLLSLSERKCVTLASRHLFPVVTIKWRPADDFMVVGCSDGTVYVWQMETGHLDRVLHGMIAEEVLSACDETLADELGGAMTSGTDLQGLANPAVHFFRGLRHRNLTAMRAATQRGLAALAAAERGPGAGPLAEPARARRAPLTVQGFRSNPADPESHILFFDIEGLIVELLSEEYSAMSPASLEAAGLITSEYMKVAALTQSASPDAAKRISDFFGRVKDKAGDMERLLKEKDKHGILAKMKEGAETMQTKLQAKAEQLKGQVDSKDGTPTKRQRPRDMSLAEPPHTMEIAQILISLLHAWGLDPDLDRVCESKLGLLRPMVPVCFGVVSRHGHMAVQLPTRLGGWAEACASAPDDPLLLTSDLPVELLRQEKLTRLFTSKLHWELSTTLTTNHLLSIVALANTLMSMSNASFVPEQEVARRLHRPTTRTSSWAGDEEREEQLAAQQAHIKQGWSLLATLHCVLLPDKVVAAGAKSFKRPQVEMLARRWQHHCLEVRDAAQALLLAELGRLGPKGRKSLVDNWAQFLPLYTHTESINPHAAQKEPAEKVARDQEEEFEEEEEEIVRKPSSLAELKRKQTTAVVLLGVIGAEFGQDIASEGAAGNKRRKDGDSRKSSIVEGFTLSASNNLGRLTALALTHLLLAPGCARLPAHTPLRRAAVDLLGRGFAVWEPYLDVSHVLLGLLEMCSDADKLVPSMTYGLPLTPQADSCRTARHALTLIATARPAAFITTMAREVARCAGAAAGAPPPPAALALHRGRAEVLRGIELLIERMHAEVAELLVEVMDIILHCVDQSHLKSKGLNEVFPAICRYNQVSHCPATRRIAVGSHTGQLAIYELRAGRCQSLAAHSGPVTACAFSPDGRYLVSYATADNRLSFWQSTAGMFGLGAAQTRCVKCYSTAPMADVARLNPARLARLVWTNSRTVTLMLADGSETRFNV
ncbi:WD repeat-containing protein 7 isoform X1 [Vanessa atalanta]|uniref:WD repeat-containing protein 7 isoform X1 n=1 Tax=Vanessa atalanta TaxID=42275 RepID=UPI001FCCFD23|nr:WD repeat-containing protein 7 isoform X1 [Vanessa atalanta]XP_047541634.1 WD repeat-containing protein 7 isoform X1 [Vanessa atalanta]